MGAGDPRRGRRAGAVSYLDPAGAAARAPLPAAPDMSGHLTAEAMTDLIFNTARGDRP
jgi:hypothetical protein